MAEPDRDPQFLRKSYDVIDAGLVAVLPAKTMDVYEVIWRFAVRGTQPEGYESKPHVIVATVRQRVIASLVGCGRQWVNECVGVLEAMGWLKRGRKQKQGEQQVYELGTRAFDKKVLKETLWAETRLQKLTAEMRRHGPKKRDFPDTTVRHGIVWNFLVSGGVSKNKLKAPPKREADLSPSDDTPVAHNDTPCRPVTTPPVVMDDTYLSPPDDTVNRESLNRESLKRESSNNGAEASGLGGVSASDFGDEDLAGADASTPTESQSSAISEDDYRALLMNAAEGDDAADDEGEGNPPEDDVNEFEKRRLAMAEATNGARALFETTKAKNEAKRQRNGADKQREKNLSGATLEKHIPKGSIAKLELVWRKAFEAQYPEFLPARWWTEYGSEGKRRPGKEAGLVSQLVQMYSLDKIEKYLVWAVKDWSKIVARLPNKKLPAVPAINILFAFRESMLPEALKLNDRDDLEAQLHAWYAKHPGESPPADLLAKLKAMKAGG